MKLCMSHYNHKSIPDAKFEAGSSSSFGDMMSQNFPRKKERVIKFGYLLPENGFNFKLNVNFSNFQAEKIFSFSNFLGRLDEKRAAATPGLINFAKIWSEHVLWIESKSHQIWVS